MSLQKLKTERHELAKRMEEIEHEISQARRPQWLQTDDLPFSQWALHAGIEPLSPEADAAFDAWVASRTLYDRHLSDEDRINLWCEYQHQGHKGTLILCYSEGEDEDPSTLRREDIMMFSRWSLSPRSGYYPVEDQVPCVLSVHGEFLPNEATRRYLTYQARYWKAPLEDRPYFHDSLAVRLPYGDRVLEKTLQHPKTVALDHTYLDRFRQKGIIGAQFNIWFRNWHNSDSNR